MELRAWLSLGAVLLSASAAGCNGNVVLGSTSANAGGNGGSAAGGGGANGGSNAGGANGGSNQGGSNQGGASDGGAAVGGSNAGGSNAGAGGGMNNCAGLGEVACLGAYPQCMPVYDDKCCPTCGMGGCADCVDIEFFECIPAASHCSGDPAQPPPCGQIPKWACQGGKAMCDIEPMGALHACKSVAGCIPAYCPSNKACDPDPVCHPITKGTCMATCDAVPPPCDDGETAESDGFCYTGFCVKTDLCAVPK